MADFSEKLEKAQKATYAELAAKVHTDIPMELIEKQPVEPRPVNITQIASHGTDLFALDALGQIWRRIPDPRDFNSGPGWSQKYLWQKIEVPHV